MGNHDMMRDDIVEEDESEFMFLTELADITSKKGVIPTG
jgi:hypothetical protein